MRGAFYIRVSTEDQTELSPDAQLRALKEYAKKNKILVSEEHIFVDEGISAKTANRPAFQQMIKTAKLKPKPFDIIMVHKFDRFARNREDSVVFKSLLRKDCGIKVVSITEHIEDDKFAVILEAMLEAMAEYYSLNLADEVKKGMSEKARKGGFLTRPPFGYTIEQEGQPPVIVPEEAKIVEFIYNKFTKDNWTYYAITKHLNEVLNVKLPSGHSFTSTRVRYILSNPLYAGMIRWETDDEVIESKGLHYAIISEEQYAEAQTKREQILRSVPANAKPFESTVGLFSGLLKCSNCGTSLAHNRRITPKKNTYPYYQCDYYSKGKCKVSHSISESKVLKALLKQMLLDIANQGEDLNIKNNKIDTSDLEIEVLEKQLNSLEPKFNRIKEAYAAGIDSLEEYSENKKKLLKEEADLKERIQILLSNKEPQAEVTNFIETLKVAYPVLSSPDVPFDEKKKTIRSFIDSIVYLKSESTLNIVYLVSE